MRAEIKLKIAEIVKVALEEDFALQDITSDLTLSGQELARFIISNREDILFCGKDVVAEVFLQLKASDKFQEKEISYKVNFGDGSRLDAGSIIVEGSGDAKLIFAAERVILNLLQHLSGVATAAAAYVNSLKNSKIKILDTRKTIAGLRVLQKYAITCGGASNHRANLSDMILIKDNHIAASGGVKKAILAARKNSSGLKVEIECDNLKQVAQAVEASPDIIMLDNMRVAQIKKASALIRSSKKKILIEISGGITLKNIKKFRDLDIDFISIGSLTHSVHAVDIGLDIIL